MITILNKQQCCGCGACSQKCPKHCITMKQDSEGFLYPEVDESSCIDCGLCEKVCHELNPYTQRQPQEVLAVISKDDNIRMKSSSGGVFSLLAEQVIKDGGIVFGARFDDNWQVVLDCSETEEGIEAFRGSKYVQSRTENTYITAEKHLKAGRKVLFSGSPCQIASLHHYLGKQYDNLISVDFVCHGAPSPKVWDAYLNESTGCARNCISSIEFRNKDNGWSKFNFKLCYSKNGEDYSLMSWHQQNPYMRAFLKDMILRPSCHNCKAKHGSSMSDITIADYWGISKSHPEINDDKGTSLVLINSEKGKYALDLSQCYYKETHIDDALPYNAGLGHITKPHKNRKQFFDKMDSTESVIDLIEDLLKPSMGQKIRMMLGRCKRGVVKVVKKLV